MPPAPSRERKQTLRLQPSRRLPSIARRPYSQPAYSQQANQPQEFPNNIARPSWPGSPAPKPPTPSPHSRNRPINSPATHHKTTNNNPTAHPESKTPSPQSPPPNSSNPPPTTKTNTARHISKVPNHKRPSATITGTPPAAHAAAPTINRDVPLAPPVRLYRNTVNQRSPGCESASSPGYASLTFLGRAIRATCSSTLPTPKLVSRSLDDCRQRRFPKTRSPDCRRFCMFCTQLKNLTDTGGIRLTGQSAHLFLLKSPHSVAQGRGVMRTAKRWSVSY